MVVRKRASAKPSRTLTIPSHQPRSSPERMQDSCARPESGHSTAARCRADCVWNPSPLPDPKPARCRSPTTEGGRKIRFGCTLPCKPTLTAFRRFNHRLINDGRFSDAMPSRENPLCRHAVSSPNFDEQSTFYKVGMARHGVTTPAGSDSTRL